MPPRELTFQVVNSPALSALTVILATGSVSRVSVGGLSGAIIGERICFLLKVDPRIAGTVRCLVELEVHLSVRACSASASTR